MSGLPRGRQAWAVVAAAVAAYAATLGYGLVWDDRTIIQYVATTVQSGGLSGLLSSEFLLGSTGEQHMGYFRPVVLLSFWLDSRFDALAPGVYHATNVVLHATNSALVVLLLEQAFPWGAGPLLGGLLFALHPVHTESVAFVSGRTDLLAALFVLASAILWLQARRRAGAPHGWQYYASLFFYLLASFSKEVAFLLPAVLVGWDTLIPGGSAEKSWWRRNGPWLAGWLAALALVFAVRWWGAGVGFGLAATDAAAQAPHPGVALGALATYFRLLLLPWPLNAYYTEAQATLQPVSALGAGLLLGLCAYFGRRRWGGAGLVAAIWMLGFLLPVLGGISIAGAPMAERFLYLPSVGLSVLAALLGRIEGRWRSRSLAAAAVALVLLAGATVLRAGVWRDEESLFTSMVRTSPDAAVGHDNLGRVYSGQGRYEEALREHEKAVSLDPGLGPAYTNLGIVLSHFGRFDEAVAAFRKAVALEPGSATAHNNLGALYARLGRYGEAIAAYRQALQIFPQFVAAYDNLGISYGQLGRYDEAFAAFGEALRLDPASAEARYDLGMLQFRLGRHVDAAGNLAQAVELNPDNAVARFNLALVFLRLGRREEAEQQRRALDSLDPQLAARLAGAIASGS